MHGHKTPFAAPCTLRALRRVWWATLSYEGWVADWPDGNVNANPAPWWAHPLAWLHRIVNFALRNHDVFGPRRNAYMARPLVGVKAPQVWE